eukprot:768539-Hanusia_phi.AAC.4
MEILNPHGAVESDDKSSRRAFAACATLSGPSPSPSLARSLARSLLIPPYPSHSLPPFLVLWLSSPHLLYSDQDPLLLRPRGFASRFLPAVRGQATVLPPHP